MEFHPEALSVRNRYKLLIGAIVPRPIALISTVSAEGVANLAPFSFFNGVGSNPMTLLFCPGNHPDGSDKDTLRNCKPMAEGGTGEFVVNVATESYASSVAAAAEELPADQSEFNLVELTRANSHMVRPPRVAESPVAFECQTTEVIRTNPGRPGGGNVVLGRVVHVFIRDDLVNDQMHIDPAKLAAIGRMGGPSYTTTRDRFDMPRGQAALDLGDIFDQK